MKNFNYQTGQKGEAIAQDFLTKKGYRIVESNFRTRFGEIDLVAAKNKKLIFVEVKLKIGLQFGSPEEMINHRKIWQIQQTAQTFLQTHPRIAAQYSSYQIDAVCIVSDPNQAIQINHYENIGTEI